MTSALAGGPELNERTQDRLLPWILAAHVPALVIVGVVLGRGIDHASIDVAPVIVLSILALQTRLVPRLRSVAVAVGMMVAASILVHLTHGRVEHHFYFFVVLALLALYDDWLPFAAAVGAVLVEHGLVGVIAPTAVFGEDRNDAEAVWLAVVHGVYVLMASVVYLFVWRHHHRRAQRAQREIHRMDELTRVAFENAPIGMAVVGLEGDIVRVNAALCRLLGTPEEVLVGRHATELAGIDDVDAIWAEIEQWVAGDARTMQLRTEFHRPDGREFLAEASLAVVHDELGRPRHLLAQVEDVTEEVARTAYLAHTATHDPLTDLPNRTALEDRLEPAIADAESRGEILGCLFIDLDGFKEVNDEHGHAVGDSLLCEVAERMRTCLRPDDFVARLGGDEFVVLAALSSPEAAEHLAGRLAGVIGLPFEVGDRRVRTRCSIGVALHADVDLSRPTSLVTAADVAMYRAKAAGRGSWARFQPGDTVVPEPAEARRSEVEGHFRQMLDATREAIAIHVEGTVVAISQPCVELLGATDPEEIIGRSVEEFLASECLARLPRRLAAVQDGGWPDPEDMRVVTLDGAMVDVEIWTHPVVWGAKLAHQLHLRRIDSPLAEIARLGAELGGPDGGAVIVVDNDARVVAWNRSAADLFGWSADEAVGRLITEVLGAHDEADMDEITRGLENDDSWTGVKTAPTRSGAMIDVRLNARVVRDWRGTQIGVVLLARGRYTDVDDEHRLLRELERAVCEDELVVHYQPIVRAEDGVVVKVEALVRWQHPELGLLPPSQFIPLAEGTPVMPDITRCVLQTATQQVAQWRGHLLPALELTVNVSANELADPRLVEDAADALRRSGLPAGALWLEVTETDVADDPASALEGLQRLRELGCHTVLDDFGTGFASLAQLHRLPVQALKIDRMFVAGMADHAGDAAIVRSIIGLAAEIGLTVIAEGVETDEQRRTLRLLGCDQLQGYLLGLPSPADPTPRWALRESVEEERLAALRACRILDTPREPLFDRIVDLAARLCQTRWASLAFIDENRLWHKATTGFDRIEMPRDFGFAEQALASTEPLVVGDATADGRFRELSMVEQGIRAYVGVPIVLEGGHAIGVLSVIDDRVREFSARHLTDLGSLATQIEAELGVRRSLVDISARTVVAAARA
jgi:diguanylate cyclase (GGDEF)-like protein/PAS domain S-box-containing protein